MESLKNRDFLTLLDFEKKEIEYLLELSKKCKFDRKSGIKQKLLENKNIALIFEKNSTRTRCAFEIAAFDLGMGFSYLAPGNIHMGSKESVADTARVISSLYDAIQYRGDSIKTTEELAKFSSVPVINGLNDKFHPTQALADFLSIIENSNKDLKDIKITYIGNSKNNVSNSLIVAAHKLGSQLTLISPKEYFPEKCILKNISNNNLIKVTEDVNEIKDSDFIYTDVWLSMGEPDNEWEKRIKELNDYRVTMDIIKKTNNKNVKFLHCLPAMHDEKTSLGQTILEKFGVNCLEVTDEVFESKHSIVFEQAENRMHTIKALLISIL